MTNMLIAQSGGPTSAINATLAGIITGGFSSGSIDRIYGAHHGIKGVLEEDLIYLNPYLRDTFSLDLLSYTPSSSLGSCRFKLDDPNDNDAQYLKIIETLRNFAITYFFYIGGNDSMDTVEKLSRYLIMHDIYDIKVIGVPKTIDNDLLGTDHCPGFGSAAKYIATTFSELERDCSVYDIPAVTIVEVMGRNAGWLTASSALSRLNGGRGPSLIYLCEKAFSKEQFIKDVKHELEKHPDVLIAISEGIKDENNHYISADSSLSIEDAFGHSIMAGASKVLENLVRNEIGCKVRSIELNLMQRCAAHISSATDLHESRLVGLHAFQCAKEGMTGVMAAIERISDSPYSIVFRRVRVKDVANFEKKVPPSYISENGHDITEEMMTYLTPLIQGESMPTFKNGIPLYQILT